MSTRLLLLVEEGIVFNYKFPLSIRVCSLSPSLSTIRVVWWHDSIGSRGTEARERRRSLEKSLLPRGNNRERSADRLPRWVAKATRYVRASCPVRLRNTQPLPRAGRVLLAGMLTLTLRWTMTSIIIAVHSMP